MRCSYSPERYESESALVRSTLEKRPSRTGGSSLALEVKLRIDSLDAEGRGVARNAEGKVTFVEGALPGEEVDFQVLRKKSSFEIGRLTKVLGGSSSRQTPRCPHFGVCGGCSLQHTDARTQMAAKQRWLEENLARIGVEPETLLPIVYGEDWHYRRRARLGARYVLEERRRDGRVPGEALELHHRHARVPRPSGADQRSHPAAALAGGNALDPGAPAADRGRGRR